jgi:hypothetical protein
MSHPLPLLLLLQLPSLFYPITAAAVENTTPWTVGQTVNMSSGIIQGHTSPWASRVSEYLGIPFAKTPVGELIWSASGRYEGMDGVINGHM